MGPVHPGTKAKTRNGTTQGSKIRGQELFQNCKCNEHACEVKMENPGKNARLETFYKIINNQVEIPMPLQRNTYTHSENSQTFQVPFAKHDFYKNSFFPRTARDWNALPNNVVTAENLVQFKESLRNI